MFLASYYSTGKRHAGRIITLGIDENSSAVIIEYMSPWMKKRLIILSRLAIDHVAEFELMLKKNIKKLEIK